jgi:hypothetical protein
MDDKPHTAQAGYAVEQWATLAGISRAGAYKLPADLRPQSVKIGKRRIIIEQPADWLRRVAEMQRAIV